MKKIILTMVLMTLGLALGFSDEAAAQQGVINLDETVITGRIQKPEAFYILQHANLQYEKLTLKKSFLPELLETVEEKPF